jgi:hypothetical protein
MPEQTTLLLCALMMLSGCAAPVTADSYAEDYLRSLNRALETQASH